MRLSTGILEIFILRQKPSAGRYVRTQKPGILSAQKRQTKPGAPSLKPQQHRHTRIVVDFRAVILFGGILENQPHIDAGTLDVKSH